MRNLKIMTNQLTGTYVAIDITCDCKIVQITTVLLYNVCSSCIALIITIEGCFWKCMYKNYLTAVPIKVISLEVIEANVTCLYCELPTMNITT